MILRALPVQQIEVDDGVIIKRGCTEFIIHGEYAAEVVQRIFSAIAEKDCTVDDVMQLFAVPDRADIQSLIQSLLTRHILVSADSPLITKAEQDPIDVFYWHFGMTKEHSASNMAELGFSIVGVNRISLGLIRALKTAGAEKLEVVDDPMLRNADFFSDRGSVLPDKWTADDSVPVPIREREENWTHKVDCLIASSDTGGQHLLRRWNELCIKNRINFLPVLLQDMVGYIGPFVVPGESPCLECLRSRQNSQMANWKTNRASEYYSSEAQQVLSVHPAMISTLVDCASFEIIKFFNQLPNWHVGDLIEVKLLVPAVHIRKVLKVPRCPVCGRKRSHPTTSIYKNLFAPEYSNQKREMG